MCQSTLYRASLHAPCSTNIMSINWTIELVNCDRVVYISMSWGLGWGMGPMCCNRFSHTLSTALPTASSQPHSLHHCCHPNICHPYPAILPPSHSSTLPTSLFPLPHMYISSPNFQHPPPLHLSTSCILSIPSPNHTIFQSQPPTLLFLLSVSPITSSSSYTSP